MPDDQLPRGIELTSLSETFREDPRSVLNAAREACPVYRDGVLRDYVVLSAEIGRKVLSDRTLLTDPRMSAETSTRRLRGEPLDCEPPMLFADNPSHKRLRGLLGKALNFERVERMRPRVTELCEELIGGVADGPFDLITQVARPLPTIVIAQLLGVDSSRHADFKLWSDQIVAATSIRWRRQTQRQWAPLRQQSWTSWYMQRSRGDDQPTPMAMTSSRR